MRFVRWLRWPAEAIKLLVPAALTAVFLVLDVRSVEQDATGAFDWQYWALASLGVFCLMVLIDFARLLSRVRQLESSQATLRVTTVKEMIPGELGGRPKEMYWHRIVVHNESDTVQARDIAVKLHGISPNPLELNPCPSVLNIKGNATNAANPGDNVIFDFIRDTKYGVFNLFTSEFHGQDFTLMDQDYVATISVSASNAKIALKKIKLRQPFRREDGALHLDGDLEVVMLDA